MTVVDDNDAMINFTIVNPNIDDKKKGGRMMRREER